MSQRTLLNSHVSTLALVLVAGLVEAAAPAHAACTNNPPATGQTVDCTGAGNAAVIAPPDAATGIGGATGVTVNVAAGASLTGVGQTVAGANAQYSGIFVNDSSTVNIGTGATVSPALQASKPRDYVGVNLNGSDTTLTNNGTISLTNDGSVAGSTTYRLYGVISSVPGTAPGDTAFENVQVTNNGTISISQSANAVARGIYSGEGIDSMTIDNFGTISVTRTGNFTSTQATAGIDSDDDTDTLVVNNHKGATISSTGGNTYAVSGRAGDYTLQNDGMLTTTGGKGAIGIYGGADDGPASTSFDNSKTGIVTGDVYIKDTSPLGATLATSTNGTRDSDTTNEGTINGSFFLGAGAHTLDNTGTISGSINVNQTTTGGAFGAATFSLTNEDGATLSGNIAITDRADSVNDITLTGTGFNAAGAITATGNGTNSLTVDGVTNLKSVAGFTALDLMQSNVAVTNGVTLITNAANPTSQISTTVFGPGGTVGAPSTNLGSIQGTLTLNGAATSITPIFATGAHDGDVYQLASTVNGTGTGAITVDNTSALVTTTATVDDGRLLLTTAVDKPSSTPGVSGPGAQVLDNLLAYSGSDPRVQALAGAVENLTTTAQVQQAGKALSPIVDGAAIQVPINATMMFAQQVDTRLDQFIYAQTPSSGRSADLGVPHAAPVYGVLPASGAWIEGVGGGLQQGDVNGVAGYKATFTGVVGGYDRLIIPGLRVGGAFGFVDTQVNGLSNGLGASQSIQTYQGLGYAEFAQDRYYVRGSVGYGGVDYQSSRQVSFNGVNDSANGRHNGNILTVRGESGLPYEFASGLVVPYAAFTYGHLTQDAYAETSFNGAGFNFGAATNDSERSEVGGKVLIPLSFIPVFSTVAFEARAAYVHEFGNVGQTVNVAFAGGAPFTVSGPVPNRDMVDFGAGLRMGSGPVEVDISYNGLARSTFYEQYGLLRARYAF